MVRFINQVNATAVLVAEAGFNLMHQDAMLAINGNHEPSMGLETWWVLCSGALAFVLATQLIKQQSQLQFLVSRCLKFVIKSDVSTIGACLLETSKIS